MAGLGALRGPMVFPTLDEATRSRSAYLEVRESGGTLASREAQASSKVGRSQQSEYWAGITLLAVIAKLFCSVLPNRMTSHMQMIGLEAQCGFMPSAGMARKAVGRHTGGCGHRCLLRSAYKAPCSRQVWCRRTVGRSSEPSRSLRRGRQQSSRREQSRTTDATIANAPPLVRRMIG